MSQRHNDNTKRPMPKENQQRALGPVENTIGVTYLNMWEYTQKVAASSPKKLLQFYLVVQGRAQLKYSSHIVKVGVEATS